MASTWSGVSIEQYSRYFDTVYISLYKYLGAPAGAVLAGSKEHVAMVRKWMKTLRNRHVPKLAQCTYCFAFSRRF